MLSYLLRCQAWALRFALWASARDRVRILDVELALQVFLERAQVLASVSLRILRGEEKPQAGWVLLVRRTHVLTLSNL